MAQVQEVTPIDDIDIEADIHHRMTAYPPFMHDRHQVELSVNQGVVTVSGYVKSAVTYDYVLNHVGLAEGVKQVVADAFYNDEGIRLQVGKQVAPGVMVSVEYGGVILSGHLPDNADIETMIKKVSMVPGVHRIITSFM